MQARQNMFDLLKKGKTEVAPPQLTPWNRSWWNPFGACRLILPYVQSRTDHKTEIIPMSNQNQNNPGQQRQNPSQKPGQQQGGGQKPGQQQQDSNRQANDEGNAKTGYSGGT
jgi:hypothetical protein